MLPKTTTMQWKMSDKSLFAMLMRSPWWVSIAIAIALGLAARALFPASMTAYAPFIGFPFIVTGALAARRQWRLPGAKRVGATLNAVGAMSWREFSAVMEQAFARDGYEVTRIEGAADFAAVKGGRTALVACKRWKAANLGIEPLRELEAARRARDAHLGIFVGIGVVSDNARRFAVDNDIRLMQGPELAQLLPRSLAAGKAAA